MQAALVHRGLFLALMFAAGCTSMLVKDDESELLFSPRVADAEVSFAVVDRRPAEAKVFRTGDLYGVESFFYGDSQFFPNRDRALTTRFAEAFRGAPQDTALIIERLDIGHRVVRGPDKSKNTCEGSWICLPIWMLSVAAERLDQDRNLVVVHLSGSFQGIAFDVTEHADYGAYSRAAQLARVVHLLHTAVDRAVDDVRARLDPNKQMQQSVIAAPALELPRAITSWNTLSGGRNDGLFGVSPQATPEWEYLQRDINEAIARARCFQSECLPPPCGPQSNVANRPIASAGTGSRSDRAQSHTGCRSR